MRVDEKPEQEAVRKWTLGRSLKSHVKHKAERLLDAGQEKVGVLREKKQKGNN